MPFHRALWLPHTPPAWVDSASRFFLTLCCRDRNSNSLAHPEVFETIVKTLDILTKNGRVYPFIVLNMPDHLHGIFSFPRQERMPWVIKDLKRYLRRTHSINWQEGFFDHRLRNRNELRMKWAYIEQNPVKKGLVEKAEAWPYVWKRMEQ